MVKSLKRWVGRETTYSVNGTVYHGTFIYDYLNETGPESADNRKGYFFKPEKGKKIRISPRTVRAENGGLVSKPDK